MRFYTGPCRITVTSVSADYPQRVMIRVTGGTDLIVPGEQGATRDVEADRWELLLQHQVNGDWHENVRAIAGSWHAVGDRGARRQVIRSKDRDQARDQIERNLVVTLERGELGAVQQEREAAGLEFAAPSSFSTQSPDTWSADTVAEPSRMKTSADSARSAQAAATAADLPYPGTSTGTENQVW
jgi:hypothetical protein